MLSVPCHPVGSEGGHQGDRTTDLRARSEPGASVLPLAASFSTGARCRDARKGRLYTWRQASPPPGARHHLHLAPGITSIRHQASSRRLSGREISSRAPGQDARKGRLPAVEVSGARHNPAAYQAGKYHLA